MREQELDFEWIQELGRVSWPSDGLGHCYTRIAAAGSFMIHLTKPAANILIGTRQNCLCDTIHS